MGYCFYLTHQTKEKLFLIKEVSFLSLITKLLIFKLILSCTQYAEYTEEDGRLALSLSNGQIESVQVIDWNVGDNKTVSKGVELRVKLPRLDRDLMSKIYSDFNADSWGIRVSRVSMTRGSRVGEIFVPIISTADSERVRSRSLSPKSVSFRLFYPDAAVSNRLENLPCPAFGHRLKISRASVERVDRDNQIFVNQFRRDRASRDIREVGYFPISLNAGRNLEGRYSVELGLYNSRSNFFVSNFMPISHDIRIHSESRVSIPECEGYRPPPREEGGGSDFQNFRFGR